MSTTHKLTRSVHPDRSIYNPMNCVLYLWQFIISLEQQQCVEVSYQTASVVVGTTSSRSLDHLQRAQRSSTLSLAQRGPSSFRTPTRGVGTPERYSTVSATQISPLRTETNQTSVTQPRNPGSSCNEENRAIFRFSHISFPCSSVEANSNRLPEYLFTIVFSASAAFEITSGAPWILKNNESCVGYGFRVVPALLIAFITAVP